MYLKKSDYYKNRDTQDSIVYTDAYDNKTDLKKEDFKNTEEFKKWKNWSDSNYQLTEAGDRKYHRSISSLEETFVLDDSAEDQYLSLLEAVQHAAELKNLREISRKILTPTQYRRLWLRFSDNLTMEEIAAMENVGKPRIHKSIDTAIEKIKKFLLSSEE